ncbi:hypothetical protein LTS08_000930 [Lithohypha guttulata]|nr:hypothetical protein LTS08_000930 [Lithohypha guttulata]
MPSIRQIERAQVKDRNSILGLLHIQIAHVHPEDSHPVRYDLDREELVIENYPILLADKIVPFLEPGQVEDILAGHLVRPCSKRGPYRKRTPAVQVPANERVPTTRLSPDISIEPETTDKAVRDHSHLLRESASPDPLAGPLKENIPPASIQKK